MRLTFFTLSVALRHLRYGVGQSLLTIGVVAISVLLIVYLRTVIGGTQIRIVNNVTGVIPHIVMEPAERTPIGAWRLPGQAPGTLYVGETVNLPRAQDKIEDWRQWLPAFENDPDVTVVSPTAVGSVFMFRGERRQSVRMSGVVPERHDRIVNIEANLLEGRFLQMSAGEVVLGAKLAREFGIGMRDKLRLVGPGGRAFSVTVAGIYDTGFGQLDDGQIFLTLRDGQSLLELGSAISNIGLRVRDLYQAQFIAQSLAPGVPFKVRSWITDNPNVFQTLAAQDQTINMVLISTIVAAGFGIGSILIMAVTGKYREIGILKAMGATPAEIQSIFVVEGFLLAVLGSLVGIPAGVGLLEALGKVRAPGSGGRLSQVFLIEIDPALLAGAAAVAIVVGAIAAYFPARRAASVDPMQVIRGGVMMDAPVIELRNVGKTYRTGEVETPVLFDIAFQVRRGEFVAIVGGSGSGKTTLLNLMGLLDRPTAGQVLIEGQQAGNLDEYGRAQVRRERLGFIFQFHYLLPEFTVLENALMPCRMKGSNFHDRQEPRMRELLKAVGLADKLKSRPAQLSGGQQQRVAVVRSLANSPAVVLADEPTGNLDSRSGRVVFDLMRSLSRDSGTTFVMVTHDDDFALEADRVIRISDGRIEHSATEPTHAEPRRPLFALRSA